MLQKYACSCLWTGNVKELDDALQLLLIMDYIHAWASDNHAPFIIRGLESLSSDGGGCHGDVDPVHHDDTPATPPIQAEQSQEDGAESANVETEIDPTPRHAKNNQPSSVVVPVEAPITSTPVHQNDAGEERVVVRSGTEVRHRYMELLVDEANYERLKKSPGGSKILEDLGKAFEEAVKTCPGKPLLLRRKDFPLLQHAWMGNTQSDRTMTHDQDEDVFVTWVSYTAYVESNWCLAQDLTVVGLQRDTLRIKAVRRDMRILTNDIVLGWQIGAHKKPTNPSPVVHLAQRLREGFASDKFAKCIYGTSLGMFNCETWYNNGRVRPMWRPVHPLWRGLALRVYRINQELDHLRGIFHHDTNTARPVYKEGSRPTFVDLGTVDGTAFVHGGRIVESACSRYTADEVATYCIYCVTSDDSEAVRNEMAQKQPDSWLQTERIQKDPGDGLFRWNRGHGLFEKSDPKVEDMRRRFKQFREAAAKR